VTAVDIRWTPLSDVEERADEDGEPLGSLPWVWMIANLDLDELFKVQPNILMIQSLAQAILDVRQRILEG
jgi:hypothetical protein